MREFLIFVLILVVSVFSTDYPQKNFTVTEITLGSPVVKSFQIGSGYPDSFESHLYKVFIPSTTAIVSINVTTQILASANCYGGVDFQIKSAYGIGCSADQYTSSQVETPCTGETILLNADYKTNITKSYRVSYGGEFNYAVGAYWYITATRYSMSSYANACPYTLIMNVEQSCPANQVAVGLSDPDYVCAPVTVVNTNNIQETNFVTSIPYTVYKFSINTDTGFIQGKINGSASLDMYGEIGRARINSNNRQLQTLGGCTFGSPYCAIQYTFEPPRKGDYYIVIKNLGSTSSASLSVAAYVCGTDLGGSSCTENYTKIWNEITPATNYTTTYKVSEDSYYFLSFPTTNTQTSTSFIISASERNGSYSKYASVSVKKDGFTATSYGDDEDSEISSISNKYILIQPYETYIPGRWYINVYCQNADSNGCDGTITIVAVKQSSSSLSTTGVASTTGSQVITTGTTTGVASTTGSTGSTTDSTTGSPNEESDSSSNRIIFSVFTFVCLLIIIF